MLVVDTETCGLVGPVVTIQHSDLEGPISIHEVWRSSARSTLQLVERVADTGVMGFNLTFDWFQIQRLHNVLRLLPPSKAPTIPGWRAVEREACSGPCVKPRTAMDVFLHARKGPYQSLMERDDIKIRRVPAQLAPLLAAELEQRLEFPGIYFSRRKDGYQWQVVEDENDPAFPDVVLRFGASGGLKPLARHVLGVEALDFPIPKALRPEEDRWNIWGSGWVRVLLRHVAFWATNKTARRYAEEDVEWTRQLWRAFGSPEPGDDDSVLACQVGSARWRGYALDLQLLDEIKGQAVAAKESAPRAPKTVLYELHQRMDETERLGVTNTRKQTLESVAKWDGPAGEFARDVIAARSAEKVEDVCNKLLTTKRAHFDFKIIGTLSGRMSGTSKLNPQGIAGDKSRDGNRTYKDRLRDAFLLADQGLTLEGGDFDGFEVTLAAAVYNDAQLIADLQSGKKIHALYGSAMYGRDYEDVKSDGRAYGRSKNAFFGSLYGAQDPKLAETLGLTLAQVAGGKQKFQERYPGVGEAQQRTADLFCSMRQDGGIGTAVVWHEPADYVESLFGFRRYFTLENRICRALFELAQNPPREWQVDLIREYAWEDRHLARAHNGRARRVERRKGRKQSPSGATQSALYAAAFGMQARNMRAAGNHEIQSSGATITKRLQRRIWDRQPVGVHEWSVQPMNIHDEVACPSALDLTDTVADVVESYRERVPLIAMTWKRAVPHWGALK